jgi:Tfp pilus assembly pilus retraction ATPase PilT
VRGRCLGKSALKIIDRIIDAFPGDERGMVRAMLSESLEAMISKTLCKRQGAGDHSRLRSGIATRD